MTEERKNFYIKLIKESSSYREVCFKANISVTTGNYDTLKKIVRENNIDISHFKRSYEPIGKKREKILTEDVINNKAYISASRLKDRLIAEGIKEHRCENPECNLSEWHGSPIPLQLHHIDGNKLNNKIENIMLLCPNCHSLTDNWCGKNQKKKIRYCKVCGNEINKGTSLYCSDECKYKDKFNKNIGVVTKETLISALISSKNLDEAAKKIERNKKNLRRILLKYNINWCEYIKKEDNIDEIIEYLLSTKNFTKTGKHFGVSDSAIRKKLKSHGYPTNLESLADFINNK